MNSVDNFIVGGGIAGLTCGYKLMSRGYSVVVCEKSSFGGLVQSKVDSGYIYEQGATTFVLNEEIGGLLDELNLFEKIRFPVVNPFSQFVGYKGAVYEVPKSPRKLLNSSLLTTGGKLRLVSALFRTFPRNKLRADLPVQEFASRWLGEEACERLLRPVFNGIFGGSLEKLLAKYTMPTLWGLAEAGKPLITLVFGSKRRIFSLEGGNALLGSALAQRLESRQNLLRAEVLQADYLEGGWLIETTEGIYRAKKLIVATSGAQTIRYLRGLPPRIQELLKTLPYAPLLVVHSTATSSTADPKGFGALYPDGPYQGLLGIMFVSNLFPHMSADAPLFNTCFGGVAFPEVIEWSDEKVRHQAKLALEGELKAQAIEVRSIARWEKGIPQYNKSHKELFEYLSDESNLPKGLVFIGNDCGGVGIPMRIKRALTAVGP